MRNYSLLIVLVLVKLAFGKLDTLQYSSKEEVLSIPYSKFDFSFFNGNVSALDSAEFANVEKVDFGLSKDTLWLRLIVKSNSNDEDIFFLLPTAHLDSIRFYDSIEFGVENYQLAGDLVHSKNKIFNDPYPIFKLRLNEGETRIIYLRVSSKSQLLLPFSICDATSLNEHRNSRNILYGAFVGILLVMFFYNLIIFLYTKANSYRYYIIYLLSITVAQIGLTGLGTYFIGDFPRINNSLLYLGSGFAGVFSILFIQSFLGLKIKLPRINKLLYVLIALYILVIITALLGAYSISFKLINTCGGLIALSFVIISILLTIKGDRKAKFYLTAWIGLIISVVLFTLMINGVLNFSPNSNLLMPFGVVLETILLSLALADSINVLRKESEVANARVLEEVRKNEELVRDQNFILEEKVTQRTLELQTALDELKDAQSQLVQSEKMASLGVLTAGIAHEINNPINFVTSNVVPLRENIETLSTLLDAYKSIDLSNLENEMARIAKLEEEAELDYTLKETYELINGIEEGAKRTHSIVDGLKTFSRGDGGSQRKANINKAIESTISVLKSRLNGINVIKRLDKDIPKISCQIGKLNQVFLNLINNAVDTLEEKNGPNASASEISIATFIENDHLIFEIEDNGKGMDDVTKQKVFEPFFTTKEIGKGTGLGLSISYGIIEEHHGEMHLESEVGVGTKFRITLPIT